jgi:glycosyltransferase involved in cell wall biosynthesis
MTARCGVADYTAHLLPELRRLVEVVPLDEESAALAGGLDLVHVQHQYFLFGGVAPWKNRFHRTLNRLRAPVVLTAHEFVEPGGGALRTAAVRLTNRRQFAHPSVRRIIVHTEEDRRRMERSGLPVERVSVVRHGVPPAPVLPDRSEARAALDVEGRFVLTLFGFLSRRKGHSLALEALAGLPGEAVLLLAGGRHPQDGTSYTADLEAEIARRGQGGRARITGYLSEPGVAAVMAATDLALAPFTESSGSGSLALAFSCGKPTLASDIGPHREIIADAPGAIKMFAAGDAGELARGITELMQDPHKTQRLAAGAAAYAAAHSYARMAEETVAVYREALGMPRARETRP